MLGRGTIAFAKKKGTRNLAWMAAPTVAFNISEIVLFGIPIILNPIFVVPFMLVPLANFFDNLCGNLFGTGTASC